MKRSKSCEKCIFLPGRGVGVMCDATAALHSGRFVRNCPNNKVGFLGVAALWVDYMPFPEIRNNGFMVTDLCWKTIQNVLL